MADVFPYATVAVLIIGAWIGGIVLLDVLTTPDVRAWRRISQLRGFAARASALERVTRRAPVLRRVQEELDLERLIAQTHGDDTVAGFAARTGAIALMTFAVLLTVIAAARAVEGQWPAPPWVAVVIGLSRRPAVTPRAAAEGEAHPGGDGPDPGRHADGRRGDDGHTRSATR